MLRDINSIHVSMIYSYFLYYAQSTVRIGVGSLPRLEVIRANLKIFGQFIFLRDQTNPYHTYPMRLKNSEDLF